MKKIILSTLVIIAFASCDRMLPKMYTTFDKGYGRVGSFYSTEDIRIGTDTVIDG
jgi:hypothetical protein